MNNIKIVLGDITTFHGDAIVNAANNQLLGGAGVDGAIHRAAGKQALNNACAKLGGCPTGEVRVTAGFRLPVKFIFHTVGPIWQGGSFEEAKLLKHCYLNCLKTAFELHCQTIAFPSISTGVYHYPLKAAAQIAVNAIHSFHANFNITIFCFDKQTFSVYNELLKNWQQPFS